jgi:uncharacterized protein (DUF433 family)
MELKDRITVAPGIRGGKPCIKGTRIAVYDVLEYLAGGMTEDQILKDFPNLTQDDIRACLSFAAARERRLLDERMQQHEQNPADVEPWAKVKKDILGDR